MKWTVLWKAPLCSGARLACRPATGAGLGLLGPVDEPADGCVVLVGTNDAVVQSKASGHRDLVQSLLPLRGMSHGKLKPLDLSLVSSGPGYSLRAPLANATFGKTVSGHVLSLPDIGLTLGPQGGSPVSARTVAGRAVYANMGRHNDSDLILAPIPTGVDLELQLRSIRSPSRLAFPLSFPRGDRLGTLAGPSSGPAGVAIFHGRQLVASISPPVAMDAQHQLVPSSYKIEGRTLVITVDHRRASYAYPIMVDPFITEDQRYWNHQFGYPAPDFNGWVFEGKPANYIGGYQGDLGPVSSIYGPVSFGNGLNLYDYNTGVYTGGTFGQWEFRAPGTGNEAAHIFNFNAGYTANVPTYTTGNYLDSCQSEGIADPSRYAYAAGLMYRGPQATDPISSGYFQTCGPDYTPGNFSYKVFCFTTTCDNSDPNPPQALPGNEAAIQMLIPYNGTISAQGFVFMGSSLIFESDNYPPHLSGTALPSTWTNASTPVTATATDYGVGTYSLSSSAPNWAGANTGPGNCYVGNGSPNNGSEGGMQGGANTGDRNHRCPQTLSLNYDSGSLPEGAYNVTTTSQDVVGNQSTAISPVQIDRTAPNLSQPTGTAWDDRTQPDPNGGLEGGGLSRNGDDVTVTASDSLSGVARVQMLIDGNQVNPDDLQPTSGCTPAGCPTMVSDTFSISGNDLPQGPHTVSFVATDQAGNQTPQSSSFPIYSPGADGYADKGVDPPDDPNVGSTDDSASSTCTSTDPDFPGDSTSCIQNPAAPYVAAALTEPSVEDPAPSILMMGDPTVFDARSVMSTQSPSASSGTPCPLGPPLTMPASTSPQARWGLADDSGPPETRSDGRGPDSSTFADVRAQALAVHRVRYIIPYDTVTRAASHTVDDFNSCGKYLQFYRVIRYALSHNIEPLISFQYSKQNPDFRQTFMPTVSEYRASVRAFLAQFPAVKVYTAWNEPEFSEPQKFRGDDPNFGEGIAVRSGKLWRALNGECGGGTKCLVAAGDFVDHTQDNQAFRAQYFQGMGRVAPQVWAFHPYVSTLNGQFRADGSFTPSGQRLHNFLTWGPVQNKTVWISELGTFASSRQHDPGNEIADQSSDLNTFLNSSSSLFHNPRITRFYYYEWHGGIRFDTGIVGRVGNKSKPAYTASGERRPVYCVYRHRTNPNAADGLCP